MRLRVWFTHTHTHTHTHTGKGSLVLSDSEYLAASLTADIYLDTGPLISSPLALASLVWAGSNSQKSAPWCIRHIQPTGS